MPQPPRSANISLARAMRAAMSRANNTTELAQRIDSYAGQALSVHKVETAGVGNLRPSGYIKFRMPFYAAPHFSYGAAIIVSVDHTKWYDPQSTAMVRAWVTDKKGVYVGARISYRVSVDPVNPYEPPETNPIPKIEHHLTFSGLAFKPVGTDQGDDVNPVKFTF